MKVCIYGAGAIGGWIGVKLAKAGCEVSVVARGGTLEALRRDGLVLAHGATIEVQSREGEGTAVTIHLPAGRIIRGAPKLSVVGGSGGAA